MPDAAEARAEMDWLVRLIGEVRAVRSEMNVPPSILAPMLLRHASAGTMARAARWSEAIGRMARASEVVALHGEPPRNSAQIGLDEAIVVLPLEGLIDLAAERARLERDLGKAEAEAAKVSAKLANADLRRPRQTRGCGGKTAVAWAAFGAEIARLKAALQRIE